NPELIYRANHVPQQSPSCLEEYGEANILTYFRTHMPVINPTDKDETLPNFDFGSIVEDATRLSKTIDMVDENKDFLAQIIYGVTNPSLAHPGVADLTSNREMAALLIIRHFKKYVGHVLPPLQPSRDLQANHEQVVQAEINAGRRPSLVSYPNW
ncbi:hypothetical protein EK21DRAFT_59994, partial [Setomelanomma holmii]